MKKYFLAPRSGEKSYKNFQSTIKHGVPFERISEHLSETGKEILSKEEIIYSWGNREGKRSEWEKMNVGDTIIFYASGFLVLAGDLIYKQKSDELALAMWPPDENGQPWSYTFFLNKLRYFKIPLEYFNSISGYNFRSVQGFQEITDTHSDLILHKYKSFNDLFLEFSDDDSEEIPNEEEAVNVNLVREIKPTYEASPKLQPYIKKVTTSKSTRKAIVVDFEARHKRNTKIGSKGEEIVLKCEKEYLVRIGKKDLADKVTRVSLEDTSAGFDILSYDKDGNEKIIEVKSTVLPRRKDFSFNISSNEKKLAENSDNYYIYLVFGVDSLNPQIVSIKNPFSTNDLYIEPTQFLVKGTAL